MKKKFLFLTLMGAVLLPVNVGAQEILKPYKAKNHSEFKFDGHSIDEVKVAPYGSGDRKYITVARRADDVTDENGAKITDAALKAKFTTSFLDNQVIFLYHPATETFLYVDGRWGTQAILRKDFGLPMNIVDPTGAPEGDMYSVGRPNTGVGLYSESYAQGHYLGRDVPAGDNLPLYLDRGGNTDGLGADVVRKLHAKSKGNGSDASKERVFNFVFEPVADGDDDLQLYNIYVELTNQKDDYQTATAYKHYLKPVNRNWTNDEFSYYALSSSNTNGGADNGVTPGRDDKDYQWQIITREDLKRYFLYVFREPFGVDPEKEFGNFTFNLDNPDFSRPFLKTINDGTVAQYPSFWTESPADLYQYRREAFTSEPWGRYSLMHPHKDGSLSQTFQPYQYGIFEVSAQGFAAGNANVKMSLEALDASGNVLEPSASNIFITNRSNKPVYFEKISDWLDITPANDGNGTFYDRSKAELERVFEGNIFNPILATGGYNANDWKVWQDQMQSNRDNKNGAKYWREIAHTAMENGFVSVDAGQIDPDVLNENMPVSVRYNAYDHEFQGLWIVGINKNSGWKDGNTWYYQVSDDGADNGEWKDPKDPNIKVQWNKYVKFGVACNDAGNNCDYEWWGPGNYHAWGREAIVQIQDHTNIGDYICIRHYFEKDGDNYRVINNNGEVLESLTTEQFAARDVDNVHGIDTGVFDACYISIGIDGDGYEPSHVVFRDGDAGQEQTAFIITKSTDVQFQHSYKNWTSALNGNNQIPAIYKDGDNLKADLRHANNNERIYSFNYKDRYGRSSYGVYVKGEQASDADFKVVPAYIRYQDENRWIDLSDNLTYTSIDVSQGNQLVLGPAGYPDPNGGRNDGAFNWYWYGPNGFYKTERQIDFVADFSNVGDYICVVEEKDVPGKFKTFVVRVTLNNGDYAPTNIVTVDGAESVKIGTADDIVISASDPEFRGLNYAGYQDYLVKHYPTMLNRLAGKYLYDPAQDGKFNSTLRFYVKEDSEHKSQYTDLRLKFEFENIGSDPYVNYVALDEVRLTYLGAAPFVLDDKGLLTTEKDLKTATYSWIPVYMKRHFDKNAWNAFVCPVPLNFGQLKKAFGNEVNLCEITDKGLNPNYPYQIRFETKLDDVNVDDDIVVWPGHFYLVKPDNTFAPIDRVDQVNEDESTIVTLEALEGQSAYEFVGLGMHNLSHDTYLFEEGDGSVPDDIKLAELFPYVNDDYYSGQVEALLPGTADGKAVKDPTIEKDNYDAWKSYLCPASEVSDEYAALRNSPYRKFYTARYTSTQGQDKPHNAIELRGSYVPQKIEDRGNTYIFAYNRNTEQTSLIHLNENAAAGGPTSLDAFRFYIHDIAASTSPTPVSPTPAKSYTFIVGDEDDSEATEIINALIGDDEVGDGEIYNIAGQKVKGKLSPGIYMRNGKKFLVK